MNSIKQCVLDILEKRELRKRKNVDPEKYLPILFQERMGYPLNLADPQTYNQKIQWLKLYWHDPILTRLVDKYAVKDYVREKIGEQYIIPTTGVWDSPEQIPWDDLPGRFVLKCTHDSGGLVICKDKARLDRRQALKRLKKSFCHNFYYDGFEWPYKDVTPRIIMEPYMEDPVTQELRDYKFFCFDGVVKALFVATERNIPGVDVKFDFFDPDYNHLPIKQGHENAAVTPGKPACFEEMKSIAATLSQGFPHVRVDLYEVDGKVYFGEMTFSHHGGWTKFEPEEWDYTFGQWLKLPKYV